MVDLIPAEYHRSLRMRRLLRDFSWAALCLAAGLGIAGAGLAYGINGERTALARFKHMQAQAKAQQARLTELTARRDDARKQLQALDALRGGAAIGRLVDVVDAALIDRIWFQEMAFARGGESRERKADGGAPGQPAAPAKGRRADGKADDGAGRAGERAEIRGVASDHGALAEFITQLGAQPGVGQVKLIDTSARSYPGLQVVDFRLALLLNAAPGAPR